jgi:low affinity Fe/Cu permease
MTETIICALITGGLTLMGVLIANSKQQAITDTKLDELTREVREHNNFAQRVPVIEEQIKVINHRIADLEGENERSNYGKS